MHKGENIIKHLLCVKRKNLKSAVIGRIVDKVSEEAEKHRKTTQDSYDIL